MSYTVTNMKAKKAYVEGLKSNRDKLLAHLKEQAYNIPYGGFDDNSTLELIECMSEIADMIIAISANIEEASIEK